MKYLFVGLCLLSVAATFRFVTQLSHALDGQKRASTAALNRLGGESQPAAEARSETDAARGRALSATDDAVPTLIPMHPTKRDRQGELSEPGSESTGPETADGEAARGNATVRNTADSVLQAGGLLSEMKRSPPVRHQAALHSSMITPGNFEYLGAIRPPHIQQNETTFAYGGWGIAYRADGDPNGPNDGYPGSLFMVGHQNHQKVVEITIPVPCNSKLKLGDDLPVAKILQPFEDVTDGILEEMTGGSSEHFQLGGLLVTNGLLHWTMHKYYNVENYDYPSHGTTGLDLANSIAEGPWHLGPMNSGRPEWNSYKHAGYIFEIPAQEATQWFGGHRLISGLQISTGLQASSQGPAMFAYSLPTEGAPPRTALNALPLCWYSEQHPIRNHHPADRWIGGAWLTLGDKQAIVIVGRKALGEFYYGEARPQDCTPDKGYHGPPYEVELLFYSPASVIYVANGNLQAHGLEPWFRWDNQCEGGGLNQYMFETCGREVGGMTYDRERNLLYLVQINAAKTRDNDFETLPIVHVFRIVD